MKSIHTAERLVRLLGGEAAFRHAADAQLNCMKRYLSPAQMAAIQVACETVLTFELFLPALAAEYSSRLTEEEMESFIDLFSSPIGRKWVAVNAAILTATADVCQRLVEERMPQIMEIFNEQLRLLNYPDRIECITG